MKFQKETQRLFEALAQARDDRSRLRKLDDWFDDRPGIKLVSRIFFTVVMVLAFVAALNLHFQWSLERYLVPDSLLR